MSYDPSHRKPRHAGRMPQVITPEEAWPALERDAYADGADYRGNGQGGADQRSVYWSAANYQNRRDHEGSWRDWTTSGYPDTVTSYGAGAGYSDGFDGATGYPDHGGYPDYGGYADPAPAEFGEYGEYAGPPPSDPELTAPDTRHDMNAWRPGRGEGERRGLIVGAIVGFLAAGTAIGVATLAAAFVRPQASPIIAVGEAFIDRTPSALKNFAVQRFGENDKTMLLLGMYITIALIAMGIGILARRTATLGVVGIAAFGLFGAFVAITRPESRASDVIPSIIGGVAGVAALLWLERASAPVTPARHLHGSGNGSGSGSGRRAR